MEHNKHVVEWHITFTIFTISLATPPGTKIRLIGTVKVWNGLILLDAKNLHFLGGEVPDLIEDWKVQQVKTIIQPANSTFSHSFISTTVATWSCESARSRRSSSMGSIWSQNTTAQYRRWERQENSRRKGKCCQRRRVSQPEARRYCSGI